ncbi:hypothetical protein C2R22_05830 [Salinigranum rubrum]|uniref:Uncharacterized protein n=1 Tax=Salinigranum rubrum TaxID=755307 RepID=A0A2I8VH34_9EURY|nr:hypothetical protein [Salinigranum rubrum]AUV81237.1 hypothetical protein C2R22_05830 [Salinigranum rubrum]
MVERLDTPGVDLVLELGDLNAPRQCNECDADARYYVWDGDDGVSTYRCPAHLGDAVTEAGGDPETLPQGVLRNGEQGGTNP